MAPSRHRVPALVKVSTKIKQILSLRPTLHWSEMTQHQGWNVPEFGAEQLHLGAKILCGMRIAEFQSRIFCGMWDAEKTCGMRYNLRNGKMR